jgi:predicted ATP-grasp superfamily ATP-dependent carboligase
MLSEGASRGRNIMSIMVEADPRFPDSRAAAVIIEHLNKMLPVIDLDHGPLLEEAKKLEEQIRSMMDGADSEPISASTSMLYS